MSKPRTPRGRAGRTQAARVAEFKKQWDQWHKAVTKAEEMLKAIDRSEPIEGHDWANGMRRHWRARLEHLRANEPILDATR